MTCSWEQRLQILVEFDRQRKDQGNLPSLFSVAGVDWEKHSATMSLSQRLDAGAPPGPGRRDGAASGSKGANGDFPILPGMLTEVDRVLQGLGLPLDLVKQEDPQVATLDPATRRLLSVIEIEKDAAVSQEKFENASDLDMVRRNPRLCLLTTTHTCAAHLACNCRLCRFRSIGAKA